MNGLQLLGDEIPDRHIHGNKALGLWTLKRSGALIPPTVVMSSTHRLSTSDIPWILSQLGHPRQLIIRSSSTDEDTASQSLAGVFQSELIADTSDIPDAVERIRSQLITIPGIGSEAIPVIIQPYMAGPGGVYLFDQRCGRDTLVLSLLGSSAVTSGTVTSIDRLHATSDEYTSALAACRSVVAGLGSSADIELVQNNGQWVFLQFRPLTRPFPTPISATINPYFPTYLPPLCGTLWVSQLVENSVVDGVHYEDGMISWTSESTPQRNALDPLSTNVLEDAEYYYRQILFPKWDALAQEMEELAHSLEPEQRYTRTLSAWRVFLADYFVNPHEATVVAARNAEPRGTSLSPKLRLRLQRFADAAKATTSATQVDSPSQLLSLPEVTLYLHEYGFYLLDEHDFSQATLAEHPSVLVAQLLNTNSETVLPSITPTAVLRVAWLAEEDNEYKHRFSALLRSSIIALADNWFERGILNARDAIWGLTADQVASALAGTHSGSLRTRPPHLVFHHADFDPSKRFTAEILSAGDVTGIASIGQTVNSESILIRTCLATTDYPLLMQAAGAIVAIGTVESHAAIFARDIGKPLYRCAPVIAKLSDTSLLELCASPPTIQLLD